MRSKGFEGMACSMAEVMGAMVDRWGAIIMRDLLLGLTRYDDLQRSSGATNATLSARLKELELSGLIERRQYQTRPDRFEYVPTAKGRDLSLVVMAMVQVGDTWRRASGQEAPLRFVDVRSGQDVTLTLTVMGAQQPGHALDMRIEAGPGGDEIMHWRIERGADERASWKSP